MIVSNLINDKGNAASNQFIITDIENNTISFQSYNSKICTVTSGENPTIEIYPHWDYSRTTSKHFYTFLKASGIVANKTIIEQAIKNGKLDHYTVFEKSY